MLRLDLPDGRWSGPRPGECVQEIDVAWIAVCDHPVEDFLRPYRLSSPAPPLRQFDPSLQWIACNQSHLVGCAPIQGGKDHGLVESLGTGGFQLRPAGDPPLDVGWPQILDLDVTAEV